MINRSILDHPLLTERYFYPRVETFKNPFWVDCGDARLSCYYHNKYPESKTIILFHGNGEIISDYFDMFIPIFDQMRFNIFFAEYRGYAMSTGVPGLNILQSDVEKIINAIGLPPEKLILFGRSLGSLYAVHGVYLFPTISGLIIESGIAVLLERVLMRIQPQELGITLDELMATVNREFNLREKLERYKGTTLVLHAKEDSMVHSAHAMKLFNWAPEPKFIKLFDEGDHNDIITTNFQEYFQLIYSFISGK